MRARALWALLFLPACQLLAQLDEAAPSPVAPEEDATASSNDAADAGARNATGITECPSGFPAPTGTDVGRGSAVYFVVTDIEMDPAPPDGGVSEVVGFDLDCIDSRCEPGTAATQQSCTRLGRLYPACDGLGGVDNLAARFVADGRLPRSVAYRSALKAGRRGLLLGIAGWSGAVDDPYVTITVMPSAGTIGVRDGGTDGGCKTRAPLGDGGTNRTPWLDGCDLYAPDDDYIQLREPLVQRRAYVRAGRIYFDHRLGGERLPVLLPYKTLDFKGLVDFVSAELSVDANGTYRVRGTIGGRVPAEAALETLAEERDTPDGSKLCEEPAWDIARAQLCAEFDLGAVGSRRDDPCRAISFGARFEGVQVEIGPSQPVSPPEPASCRDAGVRLDCE